MNKLETAWSQELWMRQKAGDVLWYAYEALTLRLGKKCAYTPDFVVLCHDGTVWCDEVKGFWRDDARVKIKTAAQAFPWLRFQAIQKGPKWGPVWQIEEIEPHR
jgi:hypothetical protein